MIVKKRIPESNRYPFFSVISVLLLILPSENYRNV